MEEHQELREPEQQVTSRLGLELEFNFILVSLSMFHSLVTLLATTLFLLSP